jgi:transcription antitermination factor NusG
MLIATDDPRLVWLLVRTKPKQEGAVTQALAARGVPAYFPRVLEPRPHVRAPHGPVPLFPAYVFARCVVAERYALVHYCPGAAGVVRFGEALAAVEDDFVGALREREGERGYLVIGDARKPFAAGARVRVVNGPLRGVEGIVTRYLPAKDRVRLLLAMVSGPRHVEVDARHIRSG